MIIRVIMSHCMRLAVGTEPHPQGKGDDLLLKRGSNQVVRLFE